MEVVIVVLLPVLFLVLAASMLVVSQLSSFFQFGRYSGRRRRDREELERFMTKLATAQSQVAKRRAELEKLSSRLQDSNEELARLNSMKSKFLSMAVHDVRTPLASIKGFGEMLSRQQLEGSQKKYVDYIVRGTDQINALMSDLTDLAVIEAGKLRLEKKPFQLNQLVMDQVPGIEIIAKQNGVEFVWPQELPPVEVVGDRNRLGRALMNFLNNAVKFTPSGGRVELQVKVMGRNVTLGVKDNGPGIHPTERRKVFEKFYQSQFQDMKNKKKGWGLGLAIATEIIRGHQGDIGVESPGLGKGSTFWYRVPLKPARVPAMAAALALALVPGFILAPGVAAAQQSFPMEEKARFERALEQKAESLLLAIVGPTRCRVIVDATLDFTRTEKFDVTQGGASDKDSGSAFLWQNIGAAAPGGAELLPGIPNPESQLPGFGQTKSYERSQSFPATFIKKLIVTVVHDATLTAGELDDIRRAIPEALGIQPERGDDLVLVRARFAPAWKTIWYQPEAMSLLFKYGLIALMTLITLVVVAACFLKLAEAMDSMAQAQAHQLQMDFGGEEEKKEGEEGGEEKKEGEGEAAPAEGAGAKVVFNVGLHQIDTLLEILRGQDAENLALIAAHLKPEVKKAFLARLPGRAYSEVLLNLGAIKFVEPDVVQTVKDELERRLDSAVGGRRDLLELIADSDMKAKKDLLAMLEMRDPELYSLVRARVLLFEDVAFLDARDWSIVMGQVTLEQWATALHDGEEAVREGLRAQMLPKTWAILEQMIAAGRSTAASVEKAQEQIAGAVLKLVGQGRVQNPAERRGALEGPPALEAADRALSRGSAASDALGAA